MTFIEGDIRDRALLARSFERVDVLFHLAAIRLTHAAEMPRLALEVMAHGTFHVLEATVNARIKRVVAASSAPIYGMADTFPISEHHHPYNNDTIYGAAKAFNEGLLASFRAMSGSIMSRSALSMSMARGWTPRASILRFWSAGFHRIARGQPPIISVTVQSDGLGLCRRRRARIH